MRVRRPLVLALVVLVFATVATVMAPWAFHIGGRWTPMLMWWGSGRLVTKNGAGYPMFLMLYPSAHFSRLRLDGRRPTGGVRGNACLCTAPGVFQYLKFSGTIYDGWRSTDGSLMTVRMLEPTIVDVGQPRAGYFDLTGSWKGAELTLDQRASWSRPFRSGLRIESAAVTLHWDPYWSCRSACAGAISQQARGDD